MNAEQYRALVNKLERLDELKIGDINPVTGKRVVSGATDSSGNLIASGTPGVYWNAKEEPVEAPAEPAQNPDVQVNPVPAPEEPEVRELPPTQEFPLTPPEQKCGPEVQAQIKAQKTFNAAYALAKKSGCDTFDWCQIVKVPGQGPMPSKQDFVTTNPMGDFDPTQFSGDFTQVRESEEYEEVPGDVELDRIREIAGTQVVESAGMPEIKASNKAAAIEIARKKGIKVFRFCGKYKVKDAKRGQGPMPKPPVVPPKNDFITTNPMGDFDPTQFSGDPTTRR